MVKIFSIEGSIGSGKSTLIRELKQSLNGMILKIIRVKTY
jgi:molybdopterin-guanine dinucleotide biosynthesis protein